MASYIHSHLASGEHLRMVARVHWWVFVAPAVLTALGLLVYASSLRGQTPVIVGAVLVVAGVLKLVGALIYSLTTELAVTDRKVIGKWGLIRRDTIEQRLDKIDAVVVSQSIFGRMFDFGTIVVKGSGTANTPIRMIAEPLEFRKDIDSAVSEFEDRGSPNTKGRR